ncbi:5-formyltetrahydrofolate cyclo-ligase [Vibrio profundum]|uniref:5-formyltetrahydrofolate cyclo-ligase n=1 Tax=Vibrio profundum TaxID=2910247 RepID=UPI003D0EB316
MTLSRNALRTRVRTKRRELSLEQRQQDALELAASFSQLPVVQQSQHIALYLSNDGELDTQPLFERLWQQGKKTYLPVLHPFSKGQLLFLHYHRESVMSTNRYGIAEPKLDQRLIIPASQLNLICVPLVAFDSDGNRLGMGGGYYDRTLEPWFSTGRGPEPIGIAYDCQFVDAIPAEAWDIPLPMIATPTKTWQW